MLGDVAEHLLDVLAAAGEGGLTALGTVDSFAHVKWEPWLGREGSQPTL